MTFRCAAFVAGLMLLGACPQPLPELEQPAGSGPEILSFAPGRGFAANVDKEYAGTEISITTTHLPASGALTVYFGEVAATEIVRDGDTVHARVPAKARTAAIEIEQEGLRLTSRTDFVVMGEPTIGATAPALAFAPRTVDDACPGEIDLPYAFMRPLVGECGDFGYCSDMGSCLVISGENLGIGPDFATTTVTFTSDGVSHLPATVLAAYYDKVAVCVPVGTWSQDHAYWMIEVETPAAAEVYGEEPPVGGNGYDVIVGGKVSGFVELAGCPVVSSTTPQAAYENGVVTIFGEEFPSDPGLVLVVMGTLVEDMPPTATVLDATPLAITVQVPSGIAQEVVDEVEIAVATPVGFGRLARPFMVMGRPRIDRITPGEVFAANPAWPVDQPWRILIEGSGFDISSTAANVVEFEDAAQQRIRGVVEYVTPVSLAVRVPANLQPGWARVTAATTAGGSQPAGTCGQGSPPDCVRILGAPEVLGFWPPRAAWGDALGVLGGPFDPQNLRQISVTWSHVGGAEAFGVDVLDATIERLLVRLHAPSRMDGSGTAQHVRLNLQTSAGATVTNAHLELVDNAHKLVDTAVEQTDLGATGLPTENTKLALAARSPSFYWITSSGAVALWDPARGASRLSGVDQAKALAISPFGSNLFIAQERNGCGEPVDEFILDARGDLTCTNRHLPASFSVDPIVALAAGRRQEELGNNTLVVVTGHLGENAPQTAHLFRGVLRNLGDETLWCHFRNHHFEQVFVVEDNDGSERVLAAVDLAAGDVRYHSGFGVDAGTMGVTLEPLEWACDSGAAPCLALVELACAAKEVDGGPTANTGPDAVLTPLVHGLPLPPGSRIIPALIGHTALVVSAVPLGDAHDEWGRLVDYAEPVRCEQVMTPCGRTIGFQQPARFVAPAFVHGFKSVHAAALPDADTAFAFGLVPGTNSRSGALVRAERWAPTRVYDVAGADFGPLVMNGYGGAGFAQTGTMPNIQTTRVRVARPAAFQLRRFDFSYQGASCARDAWVLAAAGSELFLETSCEQLDPTGERPCAIFLGRAIPRDNTACAHDQWNGEPARAYCVDPLRDGLDATPLRQLMEWPEPTAPPGLTLNPRALGRWVDPAGEERVCAVIDRYDDSSGFRFYSALACVPSRLACASTPPAATLIDLGRHFGRPALTQLADGTLLVTDAIEPIAAFLKSMQQQAVRTVALDAFLPSGISSLLVRRERAQLVAATAGALWRIEVAGEVLQVEQLLARESLPPVPGTLVAVWPRSQVYLYAATSFDEHGPRGLLALDLEAERIMGQATVLDGHTQAILARHGVAEFLIGRRQPAGISVVVAGEGEGSLRTFATVVDTLLPTAIESMAMTTDGSALLAVDSAGELFVVR